MILAKSWRVLAYEASSGEDALRQPHIIESVFYVERSQLLIRFGDVFLARPIACPTGHQKKENDRNKSCIQRKQCLCPDAIRYPERSRHKEAPIEERHA